MTDKPYVFYLDGKCYEVNEAAAQMTGDDEIKALVHEIETKVGMDDALVSLHDNGVLHLEGTPEEVSATLTNIKMVLRENKRTLEFLKVLVAG